MLKHAHADIDPSHDLKLTAFFNTLYGSEALPGEVQQTKDHFIIKTTKSHADAIVKRFQEVLNTPESFLANLPYQIIRKEHRKIRTKTHGEIKFPDVKRPEASIPAIKALLRNLFGEECFDDLCISLDALYGKGAYIKNGVAYSKPAKNTKIAKVWHDATEYLISHFTNIDLQTIRDIWEDEAKHLPTPKDDILSGSKNEKGIVRGLVQQCFGVLTRETEKQVELFFNFNRLFDLLFPPQIEITATESESEEVELMIDRKHFISYMQQLTQGGMLLRVFKDYKEAKDFTARPLFLTRESTITKPQHYTIIIDCSTSMRGYLSKLKIHINNFIDKLASQNPNAKLRLIFFSYYTEIEPKEFDLTDPEAIKDVINKKDAWGSTRLFGTIADEMQAILNTRRTEHFNSTVILFTDGMDEVETVSEQKMPLVNGKVLAFNSIDLEMPRFYTLGFGSCDTDTLNAISNAMHTPYIHLTRIGDFSTILDYTETMQAEREFLKFLVDVHGKSNQYTLQLKLDDDIEAPDVLIPMVEGDNIRVQVNDEDELTILIDDAAKVPVQTLSDKLNLLLTQTRKICSSDDDVTTKLESIQKAIEQLDELESSVEGSSYDAERITKTRDRIKHYESQLKIAKHDAGMAASIKTIAAGRGGVFKDTGTPPKSARLAKPASHTTSFHM